MKQTRARILLAIKNAPTPWEAHREGSVPSLGSPEDCAHVQKRIILEAVEKALEEPYESGLSPKLI